MSTNDRELDDLQVAARDVFGRHASSAAVHALAESAPCRDTRLDDQLTRLGFYGVLAPDQGGTLAHLARIVLEAGRAIATTRLLGQSAGLGTALALATPSHVRDQVAAQIGAGAHGTVAGLSGPEPAFRHRRDAGSLVLEGTESFVIDADGTDVVLLWSRGDDGTVVTAVPTASLEVTTLRTVDRTQVLSCVTASASAVPAGQVVARGAAADVLRRHVRLALDVAVSHDSVGLAARSLALTVDYVRIREQFGRPVGSFQAVQHQAADMAARVELARSACAGALRDHEAGAPNASVSVMLARELATTGASWVAGRALQLHGGIGYTWEHDVPLLLKRAKLNETLVTSRAERRALTVAALFDDLLATTPEGAA